MPARMRNSARLPMGFALLVAVTSSSLVAHADDIPPSRDAKLVHIESPVRVLLTRSIDAAWLAVCASPCDQWIPGRVTLRIEGDRVVPSKPFSFADTAGARQTLKVKPARTADLELILLGIGGLALGVGAITWLAGQYAHLGMGCDGNWPGDCHRVSEIGSGTRTSGAEIFVGGAVLTGAGAILLGMNAKGTRVTLSGRASQRAHAGRDIAAGRFKF